MSEFSGSGRGVQTRDGCSVEFYRQLPYMGELDPLQRFLHAGASVLELGCGTGRLTRVLLERGLAVTAVDNSPEMLAHLPAAAHAVCADIEHLGLSSKFDAVLLASHLVNHPAEDVRHAFVRCARLHAHESTHVLVQHHDPAWLKNVRAGYESAAGGFRVRVESVSRDDPQVSMTLAFSIAGETWRQSFAAVPLEREQIESLLAKERLQVVDAIGLWVVARPR
jgi:SAM-dependent methyltransferase